MTFLDISIPPRQSSRPRRNAAPETNPFARPARQRLVPLKAGAKRQTAARFVSNPLSGQPAKMPAYDHPAIVEARTVYPTTVLDIDPAELVLKYGSSQPKIGGKIRKGRWKGLPVYVLTLEERATCSAECQMWRACYGNNMHYARRWRHGPALEAQLRREVLHLAIRHASGFVVRLHALGDFYSEAYVALWAELLERHPELHVYGYSARWGRSDPVGQALLRLASTSWERFAIRFSNAPIDTCSTVTIEHPGQKPADAIVCPEQLGRTESCSTCGLCWGTDRRIAFIRH